MRAFYDDLRTRLYASSYTTAQESWTEAQCIAILDLKDNDQLWGLWAKTGLTNPSRQPSDDDNTQYGKKLIFEFSKLRKKMLQGITSKDAEAFVRTQYTSWKDASGNIPPTIFFFAAQLHYIIGQAASVLQQVVIKHTGFQPPEEQVCPAEDITPEIFDRRDITDATANWALEFAQFLTEGNKPVPHIVNYFKDFAELNGYNDQEFDWDPDYSEDEDENEMENVNTNRGTTRQTLDELEIDTSSETDTDEAELDPTLGLLFDLNQPPLRRPPVPAVPAVAQFVEGWGAIDRIDHKFCAKSPFDCLRRLPKFLMELYLSITAKFMKEATENTTSNTKLEQDRALKFHLIATQLFLRKPPKGGRRGRNIVAERLHAWLQGDVAKVVGWWSTDYIAKVSYLERRRSPPLIMSDAKTAELMCKLLAAGKMSAAVRIGTGTGNADIADPDILAKVEALHPVRTKEIQSLAHYGFGEAPELDPALFDEKLRNLPRLSGRGPNGKSNEELTAMTAQYSNPMAKKAIDYFRSFADMYANAQFPQWFYQTNAANKLVLLNKPHNGVRPLGMGNSDRRAITAVYMAAAKESTQKFLHPINVAIGTRGAGALLSLSAAAVHRTPVFRGWMHAKIDIKGAFQNFQRSAVLNILAGRNWDGAELTETDDVIEQERRDNLEKTAKIIGKLSFAELAAEASVVLPNNRIADFMSSQGGPQGGPLTAALFSICLQPILQACNAELMDHAQATTGFARAQMDDVHMFGPPTQVLAAVQIFLQRCEKELHLDVNLEKSEVYFGTDVGAEDRRLVLDEYGFKEDVVTVGGADYKGIMTDGCPDGEPEYINQKLIGIIDDQLSKFTRVTSLLRDRSPQALATCLHYCFQPILNHWMQRIPPLVMLPHCKRFQAGLDKVAKAALHPDILASPLLESRVRLPARLGGMGLRDATITCMPAYLGCLNMVLPRLVNRLQEGGALERGFLHHIFGPVMGGKYNYGVINHDAWLNCTEFGDLPDHHRNSYAGVRAVLTEEQCKDPEFAPLHMPIETMGQDVWNLQHDITFVLEQKVFGPGVEEEMLRQPDDNQFKIAYTHTTGVHRFIAMSFVTAWLCRVRLTPAEWKEMIARAFGLPSPACAPLVGMAIRSMSQGGKRLLHGHVDQFGDSLCNAKLPGDGWRRNHDFIKDILVSLARSSNYKCEDEITGLFSNILSGENLKKLINARSYRQRQGIVPDLLLQAPTGADLTPDRVLYELKTLNSKYDRNMKDGRSDGAEKRASTVYREQVAKLKEIDEHILAHPAGSDGPLVRRLKSFAGPKPLVVGKYGDLNSGLRQLIDAFAKSAGAAKWKEYNYRSEEIATARMKVHFSRVLGLAAHKGQARLLLDRIHALDGPAQRTRSLNRTAAIGTFGNYGEAHEQDPQKLDGRFNMF